MEKVKLRAAVKVSFGLLLFVLGVWACLSVAHSESLHSFVKLKPGRLVALDSCVSPSAPSDFAVYDAGVADPISLRWSDNSVTEMGYDIERCTGVACSDFSLLDSLDPDVESYNDTDVILGETYSYRVKAVGCEDSDYSSVVTAVASYNYGYPGNGFGRTEPNVLGQFLFDESSTQIVDSSGLVFTQAGTPTYSVSLPTNYHGLNKCVRYVSAADSDHHSDTIGTHYNLGTGNFKIEFWYTMISNIPDDAHHVFDFRTGATGRGYRMYFDTSNANDIYFELQSTDDTNNVSKWTTLTDLDDGFPHFVEIIGNRAGSLIGKIDGVTMSGSDLSLASFVGKSINTTEAVMGNIHTGVGNRHAYSFDGAICEFRVSANTTNTSVGAFVPAPTDKATLTMVSGDLKSSILGDTYVATGTPTYAVAGNISSGAECAGSGGAYFIDATINSSLNPGTQNFVLILDAAANNAGTAYQYIYDAGNAGSPLLSGYTVSADNTNLYFAINDGVNFHYTYVARAGIFPKDGTEHKLKFIVNKTLASVIFVIDDVVRTTSNNGTALSTVGSVASALGAAFCSASASPDNQTFDGTVYGWQFAKNTLTYDY